MNLAQRILNLRLLTPNKPVLVQDLTRWTLKDLYQNAQFNARLLTNAPNSKTLIPLIAPPSIEYVSGMLAIWLRQGTVVPLNPHMKQAELEYYLRDLGMPSQLFLHSSLVDRFHFPSAVEPIVLNPNSFAQPSTTPASSPIHHVQNKSELDDALVIYTSGTTGQPKGVVHTHSSLSSQIISLSHAWNWQSTDRIWCPLPLFHVHGIVNILLSALHNGATVEFTPREYPHAFDPNFFWDRVLEMGESSGRDTNKGYGHWTMFMGVPTMYVRLLDTFHRLPELKRQHIRQVLHSTRNTLRLWVSGSAAMPASFMERFQQSVFGWDGYSVTMNDDGRFSILERYGMTEVGMILSNPLHGKRVPGTVGRPLPGVEVKLMLSPDEMDKRYTQHVQVGVALTESAKQEQTWTDVTDELDVAGELWVKGPNMFSRYLNRPTVTASSFVTLHDNDDTTQTRASSHGPWFRTGDLAQRVQIDGHSEPYVQILGRASMDMIKSGGYKISALEIERVMLENQDIVECCVLGLPDDQWGETVTALVVPSSQIAFRDVKKVQKMGEELREWAKGRMTGYKVPRRIFVVQEIPKNHMGKMNKKQIQKWLGDIMTK